MRKLILLLLAVGSAGLAGCAQFAWVKDGATQREASWDTDTCLREAQAPASNARVNMYGGFAQNSVIADPSLYNSCMAARGYSWQQITQNTPLQ